MNFIQKLNPKNRTIQDKLAKYRTFSDFFPNTGRVGAMLLALT